MCEGKGYYGIDPPPRPCFPNSTPGSNGSRIILSGFFAEFLRWRNDGARRITGKQYRTIEERLSPFAGGKTNPVLISLLHHHPCSSAGSIPRCADFTGRPLGILAQVHRIRLRAHGRFVECTGIYPLLRLPRRQGDPSRPQNTYPSRGNTRPSAGKPTDPCIRCGSSVGKNTYLYRKLFNVDYEISWNEIVLDFQRTSCRETDGGNAI